VTVGDGLAAADVGAVAVAPAAGLLDEAPALVWPSWACVEPVVWASAARELAKVSIVTLTAATTHTATAAAATATPGLARMPLQLTCLTARENRANHIQIHTAWRATRRRYATASSVVEVQRLRTCSRSSWGSGASGNSRANAAGRIAPHP
jgi:hypothetical protein